jgi:hypothetical protein
MGQVTDGPDFTGSATNIVIQKLEDVTLPHGARIVKQIMALNRSLTNGWVDLQEEALVSPFQLRSQVSTRGGVVVVGSMNQQGGAIRRFDRSKEPLLQFRRPCPGIRGRTKCDCGPHSLVAFSGQDRQLAPERVATAIRRASILGTVFR